MSPAGRWLETLEERRLLSGFSADINFAPAIAAIPAGYVADNGLDYGDRGNGLTYGWNAPRKAPVFARHPKTPSNGVNDIEDTFAVMRHTGPGSQWQIAVPDGNYQISITAGDPLQNTGQYAIDVEGAVFLAGKVKPRAGRWMTVSGQVTVSEGLLTLTAPKGRLAKIDDIDISQIVPVSTTPPPSEAPFNGTPFSTGQTIPFAQYDLGGQGLGFNVSTTTNPGNDTYRAPDPVGMNTGGSTGNVVAFTTAGEWLNYTIDVATAGQYTLSASVSNDAAGGSFHAMIGSDNITGALAVPNTGSATTFTTVTSGPFTLAAGTQVLGIYFDQAASNGTAGNFDTFELAPVPVSTIPTGDTPFNGTPFNTGQTIPFAQYDDGGQGVAFSVATTTNPGNDTYRAPDPVGILTGGSTGNVVGYTTAGEYLNYTVDVATAGYYVLQASAANTETGGSFHAEVNGVNLTGSISVPSTSSFTTFATTTSNSFALSAGVQVIHVVLDTAAANGAVGNFDTFEIVTAPAAMGPTQPLVWNTVANAPIGVFEAHGVAADGLLYVFGGFNASSPQYESTNESEAYNPVTNQWAVIAPLPVMESHTSVTTDGTYIYIAGGYIYNPVTTYQTFGTTDVFRYDIATNTYATMAPLPSPRGGGELVLLDGELHYIGGNDGVDPTATKYAETNHWTLDLSDPNATWQNAVSLPVPRSHMASAVVDGQIYIMGGRPTGADMVNPTTTLYIWNPNDPNEWTLGAPLLQPRAVSTAAVYDGEIYLIAGTTTNYQIIATVNVYDPTTNTWTTQTSIPSGRFAPVAGVVGNTLIVTTGYSFLDNGIFSTTTWTATL